MMLTKNNYYTKFQTQWTRSDSHRRGCMLEAMIGEFRRRTLDEKTFLEVLEWIVATMK